MGFYLLVSCPIDPGLEHVRAGGGGGGSVTIDLLCVCTCGL